ncbi:arylsulfatase [Verrucomicrobia bacterium]|nr:arylsulfatase [Verrucomicrobiota bacterium]
MKMKPIRFSISFFALLVAALFITAPTSTQAERPNIVLIMADDLGFSDLGCYGSEIETPNLDAIASQGLRFNSFYNTAKCHSSRVSLLSGLYCDQAGGTSLSRATTIAEVLSGAGYSTAMSGKWHLNEQPTDFGFQRYFGHLSGACNFFTGDNTFRLNGEQWEVPKTLNGRRFYTTHAMTDFALEFLDEATSKEDPFLLYVAYNAPHYPLHAPEKDVKKYDGKYDDGWDALRLDRHKRQLESGLLPAKWKLSPRPDHIPAWDTLSASEKEWEGDRMEVFAAMVDVLDQNIGRLIASLKKKGVFENTLFMFCSDNGACPFERTKGRNLKPWDEKSYWTYDASWAHAGNTPFRLYKQNQHEGGISSPLIVHWPKGLKTKPGSVTDQPGHLIDFMATFIDVADASYPKTVGDRKVDPLQGRSLLPILQGKKREPHNPLYFHFGADRALRKGNWKLVSAKGGKWELYNLKNDRTELKDLSAKFPKRVADMSKQWFDIAENKERLSGRQLNPVKDTLSKISFRKDTSSGEAKSAPKTSSNKNKEKK